jgi:hypothetical protein
MVRRRNRVAICNKHEKGTITKEQGIKLLEEEGYNWI